MGVLSCWFTWWVQSAVSVKCLRGTSTQSADTTGICSGYLMKESVKEESHLKRRRKHTLSNLFELKTCLVIHLLGLVVGMRTSPHNVFSTITVLESDFWTNLKAVSFEIFYLFLSPSLFSYSYLISFLKFKCFQGIQLFCTLVFISLLNFVLFY